jgi:hypothetical protein
MSSPTRTPACVGAGRLRRGGALGLARGRLPAEATAAVLAGGALQVALGRIAREAAQAA